jgi:hypothetical protein
MLFFQPPATPFAVVYKAHLATSARNSNHQARYTYLAESVSVQLDRGWGVAAWRLLEGASWLMEGWDNVKLTHNDSTLQASSPYRLGPVPDTTSLV